MIPSITAKTFALIRRNQEILVQEIREADGSLKGYRPLGGSIAFTERSYHALEREFIEELGEDIKITSLFCVAEEIFEHKGQPGHEIVFVYEAEFLNKDTYNENIVERMDSTSGQMIKAVWIDPNHIPDNLPLFPTDLEAHLKDKGHHHHD